MGPKLTAKYDRSGETGRGGVAGAPAISPELLILATKTTESINFKHKDSCCIIAVFPL